ncbi:LPXTG cell wall anchor domain-containing protein [Enterococcus avium]|uniref:LPXTG cell wall anchor domain-containing protein n=1 Tax=Enterococcus avium TaxID=33945 RepID=UPI002892771F|nr:LPXTG cell wall anchor domain-containing protein [Enterococcus avium]MDT2396057.1 LPXTG cell wall anchor domain-containing protein [Enterococcus avium]MDT2420492.1 LPXTG cell wall anchor domain-containing protein [Enterococcus avium]MDT2433375.1 LPXTG cell wall anchor domain-containing protein [Enterococcus avium]MDT2442343.1 LPXTG cell wall anchor domain-containing protein [Enterococcus avium]MDT2455268.1 LPXTG cell wall anchor domain-containing protein [Enterococcus avium]
MEKDFEIKADVAKKLNDSDVTIKKDYTWLYILIGVILLLLIVIFLVWRKKKNDKKDPV